MSNEVLISVAFAVIAMVIGAAWVGGYLDKFQAKAQEKALDAMGENKASYGLKSIHTEACQVFWTECLTQYR